MDELKVWRRVITIVTIAVFVVEWLLFELIRIPYRPPEDMRTLLGVEKYGVAYFMALLAIVWLCLAVFCMACFRFPGKDYNRYGRLLAVLIVVLALVVLWPPWTVTPFELIWK